MDWLQRLELETNELEDKIDKLKPFIKTDNFNNLSDINKQLLKEQLDVMIKYHDILVQRIEIN